MRVLALFLPGLLCAATPAWSHQSSVVYSEIAISGREVSFVLQVANSDLYEALGLEQDRPATRAEAERGRDRLYRYISDRLFVKNHGVPCAPEREAMEILDKGDRFFVVLRVRFVCARSAEDLLIGYDLFFDLDPRHQGFCRIEGFGGTSEHVFRERRRTLALSHVLTAWDHARDYLHLGIEHIFTGYDHLAFLLGLLILAAGLSRGAAPASDLRSGLLHVVKVVTAFTVAHSVTLILSALEVVTLPGRLVEAVIAASIAYVAAENILRPRPQGRFLLTFGFGLVHGFGFASVLREIGLPGTGLVLSLLSFNLGVELGQLLVVLLSFPVLHVLHRAGAAGRAGPRDALLIAGPCALSLLVFSRFGLPWIQLAVVAALLPALALALIGRCGYDRVVREGASSLIFVLAILWLVERVLDRSFFAGALG